MELDREVEMINSGTCRPMAQEAESFENMFLADWCIDPSLNRLLQVRIPNCHP